jgi:hypothetical protein
MSRFGLPKIRTPKVRPPTAGQHWKIWLAVPVAATMAAFGLVAQAQAQTQTPARTQVPAHAQARANPPARGAGAPATTSQQPLQNLAGHAPAAGKRWLVRDSVAYAQASKSSQWVRTPSGLSYTGCVFHVPDHATVRSGVIHFPSGATQQLKQCQYPTLTYPAAASTSVTAPSTAKSSTPAAIKPAGGPCYFGSGGPWWAASCYGSQPTWVTSMTQEQAVPSNPAQDGALIFLWGGLESANGDTLLQDVLTWGANGNIVTNPNIWYVTPWYLWGNNSVIGSSIHVGVSDTIVQSLTASNCTSAGACTWVLKAADTTNGLSTSYTVGSDATFTLIIGSNMEVPRANGCVETPASGHAAFRDLVLKGNTGTITPSFGTTITDSQCSISMTQSATAADILWKP